MDDVLDNGNHLIADIEVRGAEVVLTTYEDDAVVIYVTVPGNTEDEQLATLKNRMLARLDHEPTDADWPELQQRAMRGGVRRLLMLDGAPTRRSIERLITNAGRIALTNADIAVDTLVDDCIEAALDVVMAEHEELPWTEAQFVALQSAVRAKAPNRAGVALGRAVTAVAAAASVNELLARLRAPAFADTVHDANLHLARLVRPGFVSAHGIDRLDDVDRYVRGIRYRLEHLGGAADRDRMRMGEVLPLEARFDRFVDHAPPGGLPAEATEIRWLLEELRIQVFAQPIGTNGSVSPKKIAQRLTGVGA